ncbi:hypothetical protein CEQ90_00480 [Lewinellaceae bacterium SD302]|nr:hypothetical protein CEQ90_00480 [Lewinellaceae bacterium SD302]
MRQFAARLFARAIHRHCYFVSPILAFLILATVTNLGAQCPTVATILIDACPTGMEENNEYVIIDSEGGFSLDDLTIDLAAGNNQIGALGGNNDININVDNDPAFPTPCGLEPGDLSIYTGGCNLVAVGPGDIIPPDVPLIIQMSTDPTQIVDLSTLCAGGQTIYVTRNNCDRSIGAFTNGGSGTRTTNFGFGGGCNESVTYDRSSLTGGNGAHYSPCDGGSYGNDGCNNVVDVSSCFPTAPPCPDPITPTFDICADAPVISPPIPLAPAVFLFPGASSVTFHETFLDAQNNVDPIFFYGGSSTMQIMLFARVEYPDGCVVIGGLTLNFIPFEGEAGNDATLNICSGDVVDLLGALGPGVTAGSFNDDDGSGVNLGNPSAVPFTGVTGGSYDFTYTTVDDPSTNCPQSQATVTVNVASAPVANGPQTLAACDNGTGVAVFNLTTLNNAINGGSGLPVNYFSNPAATIPILNPSNYASGNATVFAVVNAAGNCPSNTVAINLVLDGPPTVTSTFIEPDCNGAATGSINLTVSGSTAPYGFDWIPNSLDGIEDPTNLTAGDYFVTVTSASGCEVPLAFTLTDPSLLTLGNCQEITQATGPASADGVAQITVGGGTPGYTVNYTGPSSGSISGSGPQIQITGLVPGDYFITSVVDANGCTAALNCSFTITAPCALDLTCEELTQASGPMNGDGVARITYGNGIPNYNISVTGPSGNLNLPNLPGGFIDITDLLPGTYNLTLSDSDPNNCQATCQFTITAAAQQCNLMVSEQTNDISCFAADDGSITLMVSGNVNPVQIQWSVAGFDNQLTANGLAPNTYSVTVTDPGVANCEVIITDIEITEPDALLLTCGSVTPASTAGANDGSVVIQFEDGVGPYDIDLAGPTAVVAMDLPAGSISIDTLLAGNYTLTLTDANGCVEICTFVIPETSVACDLMVEVDTVIHVNCPGDSTGYIALDTSGFVGDMGVQWSTGNNEDSLFLDSLGVGFYSVTVTDEGVPGCFVVIDSIEISPIDTNVILVIAFEFAPASGEFVADGVAYIEVFNGIPPYTYQLIGPTDTIITDTSANPILIGNLLPGEYGVIVSDSTPSCGGPDTIPLIITFISCDIFAAIDTVYDASCPGNEDGGVFITADNNGGTFLILWSDPTYDGMVSANDLAPDDYSVTVTDPLLPGCFEIINFTIGEGEPPMVICDNDVQTSGPTATDGTADITLMGGTPPYDVDVVGPVPSSFTGLAGPDLTLNNLSVGLYTVTVIDANGCANSCAFNVNSQGCTLDVDVVVTNVSCNGEEDATISLIISGNNGDVDVDWDQDQYDGQQDLGNVPPGIYNAVVTDAAGCSVPIGPIVITDPEVLDIACTVVNDVSNPNQMDGSAYGVVTGGTAPYEVILRRFVGMASINDTVSLAVADTVFRNNLSGSSPPQGYEFVVVDANGCRDTCAFSIFEPPCPPSFITQTITDVACPGDSSGQIQVTVVNANQPVSYSWTPLLPDTNVIDNVPAGSYTLVATDTFGCTTADVITVSEPPVGSPVLPSVNCMTLNDETVSGAMDGTGQITVNGERFPFTIDVSGPVSSNQVVPAAGTYDLENLSEGTYVVFITDSSGCVSDTCSFVIGAGSCNVMVGTTVTAEDCSGPGQIALEVTGGLEPYDFEWSEPQYNGLDTIQAPAGNYAVTVTDAAGCEQIILETIPLIDNAPTLDYVLQLGVCFNDSLPLLLQPASGTPGYTYYFTTDPGGSSSIATLPATTDTTVFFPAPTLMNGETTFEITIDSMVDANGCTLIVGDVNEVIVNPADTLFFNEQHCLSDTVTIEGQQYFAGNSTDTFYVETATSCGFLYLIDLDFSIPPDTLIFDDQQCVGDTVTIEGQQYFAGNATDTLFVESTMNCGFVYLIDLDFNVAMVDTLEEILCPEDSLIVGEVVFDGNNLEGLVNLGIPSANGCDSSVYVRIEYLPVPTGTFTASACEGDTIFYGSDFYTFDDPTGSTVLENQAASGCDSLVFVSVNFQPSARVELVGGDAICLGDTAMLTFETANGGPFDLTVRDGDGNTYNYGGVTNGGAFPVSPTNSTIFTLVDVSQGGLGCPINYFGSLEVTVSRLVGRLESSQDFAGNQITCFGAADGSLIASVQEGVAPFTFTWNDSITGPVRENLGPGNYEVTITDSVGCEQVYAENLQEPAPILADPQIIPPGCNERDGFLILDTIRGGVGPYELTVDGTFYQAITGFPYRQQLPPGAYTLEIRDVADCFDTHEIFVPEPADPELLVTPDTLIQMGDSLLLSAQTSFRPDSIRWEPAGMVSSVNTLSTYAMPFENTRFFVTVSDTTGCRATANIFVQVDERVPIYVPTAFSPNTDGSNDLFQLYGDRGVERINTFRIYDRWGEMVYEAEDFDLTNTGIGWDGRHRGKFLNSQVLVYYVNATLVDGRVVEMKGDLTLVR